MVTIESPFVIKRQNTRISTNKRMGISGISIEPSERSKDFRRVADIKFCRECGYQLKKDVVVCSCGSIHFLNGNTAEMLGGYLELNRGGLLRAYFLKKQGKNKSGLGGMNQKRMIIWLMVHGEKLVSWDDNDTIDVIYKAYRNGNNKKPC